VTLPTESPEKLCDEKTFGLGTFGLFSLDQTSQSIAKKEV